MMKIIKVKSCRECPYCIETDYPSDHYPVCGKKFGMQGIISKIPDIFKIPDWCPLEDYKED